MIGIDFNMPPEYLNDALNREDAAEWVEAYRKEFQGFKKWDAVKAVILPLGAKFLGSTTPT